MFSRSQKRVLLGATLLVLLVLFIVPYINVSRYKLSVAKALSQTLGRNVAVSDVSIQTFPQPGLLLSGVVVADDPTLSAEPMLRADSVLAIIRVTSLWRGRLEISTLKLREPSVNLVRATDGRWNIESLLERARQTPSAPTAKKSPENRLRFPYIEADNGRINLKFGQEKKAFALSEADFSLWLASEDEWHMRLRARPIRTDANLTDTGTIKLEGAWRRAATLHETPFQVRLWLDDGQLGQLSSLVYGRDRGWRGGVRLSAVLNGRPDDLKILTDVRVQDFRRYDIATKDPLTLQAHCDARYNFSERQVSSVYCQSPLGAGSLRASGSFGVNGRKNLELNFWAENVPAQFLATAMRHAKKDVPEDLSATGTLNTTFAVRAGEDGVRTVTGSGESSALQLRSSVLREPLLVEATRWHVFQPGAEPINPPTRLHPRTKAPDTALSVPPETAVVFDPIHLALGSETPAVLSGWVGHSQYLAEITGDVELNRAMQIGKLVGLPTVAAELSGTAKGKLDIAGAWSGFSAPLITGTAQLRAVTANLHGVARPMKLQSAQFIADRQTVVLNRAIASFVEVHSALEISATWPRNCAPPSDSEQAICGMTFELKADQLNTDEINSLLNPKAQKRPWYAAIANTVMASRTASLPDIYASGHFTAARVIAKSATASRVTGNIRITPAGFTLDTINADLFGGKFLGDLSADFSGNTPSYTSSGNVIAVGMANVAALTHDSWASGKITASYKGTATGWNADDILASAKGTARFSWHDGAFHHINLDANGKPLQFKVFDGTLELKSAVLRISESKLSSPRSIYEVSGTASLGRDLELKLARDGAPAFIVSGTLEKPKVSAIKTSETQAALR